MEKRANLEEVGRKKLVVGIDVALKNHWAVMGDNKGQEMIKPFRFSNNAEGINLLEGMIKQTGKAENKGEAIIGMEPTGIYWKPIGHYLMDAGYRVVLINPSHTHKTKELEDNSQTKNDRKDSRVIQTLTREGKYLEPIILRGIYGELRRLGQSHKSVLKRENGISNKIKMIVDEYFPELREIIKDTNGKTAIGLLKERPFPEDIIRLGEKRFYKKLKKWSNSRFGEKKSLKVWEAAKKSIGVKEGQESARIELRQLVEEMALVDEHREELEKKIEEKAKETEEGKRLIKLPGLGYLNIGKLLGETGSIKSYIGVGSLEKLAGLNLIESSSGEKKSGKKISKRGRKLMRTTLYQIALASIRNNKAIKCEYKYRVEVKKQQKIKALTATACKMLRIIYVLVSKNREYDERKASKYYYESEIKREENICEWVTPKLSPSGPGYNSGDTAIKNIGHPLPMTLNEVMSGVRLRRDDTGRNDRVRRRKSGGINPLTNEKEVGRKDVTTPCEVSREENREFRTGIVWFAKDRYKTIKTS